MALALILRNASRAQVGAVLQKNFLKGTSVAVTRDVLPVSNHRSHTTFIKNKNLNLNLITPANKIIISAPVRLMSADHSSLWTMEKALSVGLLAIVPAAIAMPNVILDNILAVASVIHFHWGLEAIAIDYARPIVLGTFLSKLTILLVYIISATTLGSLIYFNINDIGIGKAIRRFWAVKGGNGGNAEEQQQ